MVAWEYLFLTDFDEEHIKELGLNGWELVGVTAVYDSERDETNECFFFKRQIR